MNISITSDDIHSWIKLAETDVTMRSKLLECATVYALAMPEGTKVKSAENAIGLSASEYRQLKSMMLSEARYK